jgi:Raf kinase inhibitor-like YbhB/YbcL family protein
VAWDIPASTTSLPVGVPREDASLVQAVNDFGNVGFDGPEPPAGAPHRYQFSVHALPVETLGVEQGAPNVQARFAIFTQQLTSTSLTARYQVSA